MSAGKRILMGGLVLAAAALACSAPVAQEASPTTEVASPTAEVAQVPTAGVAQVPTTEEATATPYVVTATPDAQGVIVTTDPSGSSEDSGDSGASDCLYNAVYVADLTIPDGAEVQTGTAFIKTWRVQNNGCQTWPNGTTLVFVSGDQMGGPASVAVPETAPTGTQDISLSLTAPGSEGTYQAYWQLRTPDGIQFGDKIFVKITAKAAAVLIPTRRIIVPPGGFNFDTTPTWQAVMPGWQLGNAKFSLSYAGTKKHCVTSGQQIWVKVKNTGNIKLESSYFKLEVPPGTQLSDGTKNSPFLPSFACGSGQSSLATDDTAWMVVGGTVKSFVSGTAGKATVKLCSMDDQSGFCSTKTVSFTID